MVPDRLPEALREVIAKFPPGALQFEVALIQTFDDATSRNISRRQNLERLEDNLRFFASKPASHIHADLIVGLPGEDMACFGRGFDRLLALRPQEIQIGILKRLRAPIVRHDAEWQMIYSPNPPLPDFPQNKLLDFAAMQRMRRFARFWDLIGNSGNFVETVPLLWLGCASAFESFLTFSDWIAARIGRHHSIALATLAENLFVFLDRAARLAPLGSGNRTTCAAAPCRAKRAPAIFGESSVSRSLAKRISPKRQSRHLAGNS